MAVIRIQRITNQITLYYAEKAAYKRVRLVTGIQKCIVCHISDLELLANMFWCKAKRHVAVNNKTLTLIEVENLF